MNIKEIDNKIADLSMEITKLKSARKELAADDDFKELHKKITSLAWLGKTRATLTFTEGKGVRLTGPLPPDILKEIHSYQTETGLWGALLYFNMDEEVSISTFNGNYFEIKNRNIPNSKKYFDKLSEIVRNIDSTNLIVKKESFGSIIDTAEFLKDVVTGIPDDNWIRGKELVINCISSSKISTNITCHIDNIPVQTDMYTFTIRDRKGQKVNISFSVNLLINY